MLLSVNSRLFALALLLLAMYSIIAVVPYEPQKKSNEKIMEESSQFTSHIIESINGEETIKSLTAEKESAQKARRLFDRLMGSVTRGGTIPNRQSSLTGFLSTVRNCGRGSWGLLPDDLTWMDDQGKKCWTAGRKGRKIP